MRRNLDFLARVRRALSTVLFTANAVTGTYRAFERKVSDRRVV